MMKAKCERSNIEASYGTVPALDPPRTWQEVTDIAREEHALAVAAKGLQIVVTMEDGRAFVADIDFDADTGLLVGIAQAVPGAHTQAETLEELRSNLKEVLELCLAAPS